jgi:hypothetical protein
MLERFVQHLQQSGYHPRSDKHSNALAEVIALDIVMRCRELKEKAIASELAYDLNFTLMAGTADWNIDLVLGQPAYGAEAPKPPVLITRQKPSSVEIAIEIKAVMTEHQKAVKNRKRDLEAHHEHTHNYNPTAIAGGVLVINMAETFQSPLRQILTKHRNPRRLVEKCVAELRAIRTRQNIRDYGLEAKCAIVVEM